MAAPDGTIKTAPEVPENSQPAQPEPELPPAPADSDPGIDNAVNDIVRTEADDELRAQDKAAELSAAAPPDHEAPKPTPGKQRGGSARKRWSIAAAVLVVLAVPFIVPYTRYEILGLFVREKVTVQAVDSRTGAPVSGAEVRIGNSRAETDVRGEAILHPHTGNKQLQVTKKYYQGANQAVQITMSAGHNTFKAALVALGRQVKVKLVNKITNKPLANAEVTAAGASTKTGTDGMANMVLPSGASVERASVSLSGYNSAQVSIDANGDITKNTFSITPAGKVYFLSNMSGAIDVVKTNLDGTDRQTVLPGTGKEDPNSTLLLASSDWKYMALLSARAGGSASLYLINATDNDKLTPIDNSNAVFTPVGWSNGRFIYEVDRSASVQNWQSGQQIIKSFDPVTGRSLLLAQTQASGTSGTDYVKQTFGTVYLLGNQVVFARDWYSGYSSAAQLNSKQAELDSVDADGTNHSVIKSFSLAGDVQQPPDVAINVRQFGPSGLYVRFDDDTKYNFYTYTDGTITANNSLTQDSFYQTAYPAYLLSPSGDSTFWTEQRDGKNALLTGDENGNNKQQIATLSDYSSYGWYTDNYLLVSKSGSELYVMPAGGGAALKITDYFKPPVTYNGYGGS